MHAHVLHRALPVWAAERDRREAADALAWPAIESEALPEPTGGPTAHERPPADTDPAPTAADALTGLDSKEAP